MSAQADGGISEMMQLQFFKPVLLQCTTQTFVVPVTWLSVHGQIFEQQLISNGWIVDDVTGKQLGRRIETE
jgi:hypothetical protein